MDQALSWDFYITPLKAQQLYEADTILDLL
jgi:hypothetical protein